MADRRSLRRQLSAGLRHGLVEVWGDIASWFYLGLGIAALITVFVPDALMVRFLGGGLGSMTIMLLVGIPLYICASASTPIAAALILKGVSPGAALVFLLVGPATNITSLTVIFRSFGTMSTWRYLVVLALGAVGFGLTIDHLYGLLQISPRAIIGEAADIVPRWLQVVSAAVLLLFSVKPVYRQLRRLLWPKKIGRQFVSGFPEGP